MEIKAMIRIMTIAVTDALFLRKRSMASLKKPMGLVSKRSSLMAAPCWTKANFSLGKSGILFLSAMFILFALQSDTGIDDAVGQVYQQNGQQGYQGVED